MNNILILPGLFLLYSCTLPAASVPQNSLTPLYPSSFTELNGWNNEQAKAVKPTLLNSCQKLSPKALADSPLPSGTYKEWRTICRQLSGEHDDNLKKFFEKHFSVYQIDTKKKGLFTGYYSPIYEGRLQKEPGFEIPLLKYPARQGIRGIQVNDTRRIIEQKIRAGKIKSDQVLVWIKSPVDKFFLQIQGSGNIRLKDGKILHAAYGGNNKQPYLAIGRVLKQKGELDEVSMETIRDWLAANPEKQQALFNQNPRYIFFRKGQAEAITAQGIPATPYRTMAVDPRYIPYGTPLWVDTELTLTKEPYRQMMVAQDTGSAIKGTVRGDIYMGAGEDAAALAGPQQAAGKLYVFLPKPSN